MSERGGVVRQRFVAGSRDSRLARWQTDHVADGVRALAAAAAYEVEVRLYKTTGDRILERPLAEVGGKSLFTKELDDALLRCEIDFAVHSLKDVPTELPRGLVLTAVLPREQYYDALVLPASSHQSADEEGKGDRPTAEQLLAALPPGSVVGTSSPRRVAQLRRAFPDLRYESVRGNLDTRLAKLDRGEFQMLVLADAGLRRLGLGARVAAVLAPPLVLPAVGQGALGVMCRESDVHLRAVLGRLACPKTTVMCMAERAFLHTLEGGCSVPVGVHVQLLPPAAAGGHSDSRMHFDAVVLSEDGSECASVSGECSSNPCSAGHCDDGAAALQEAEGLGRRVAEED